MNIALNDWSREFWKGELRGEQSQLPELLNYTKESGLYSQDEEKLLFFFFSSEFIYLKIEHSHLKVWNTISTQNKVGELN